MSLKAVRHAKQRLAPDPRNLHWANDTNKFGFKMMEKMGWSQGKGLGANEDGVQEHVKVRLKEDKIGVGATKKSINNWLGNTDAFSKLLEDLNQRVEDESQGKSSDNSNESESEESESEKDKKKSSRKSKKDAKEKKSKKEKKEKKEKKSKKSKDSTDDDSDEKSKDDKVCITAAISGRKASRHKYLKNKHAAIQNADRLNEILGIKSETASPATSGMSTPVVEEPMAATDIFAARMQQNNFKTNSDVEEEPARPTFGGLGFATSAGLGSSGYSKSGLRGLGFVKATVSVMPATIETKSEEIVIESISDAVPVNFKDDMKNKKEKKEKKNKKERKEKKEKKEKKNNEDKESSKKDKKRKADEFSSVADRTETCQRVLTTSTMFEIPPAIPVAKAAHEAVVKNGNEVSPSVDVLIYLRWRAISFNCSYVAKYIIEYGLYLVMSLVLPD
ncbi:PIN2/TERF1-interacting telomerase inhibitor 1 [Entomortierella beljakovae]|nr:PIN2/TERF1-interacting telomerase inhibitor 1 [Entomortierella beljakovae]